MNCKDFKDIITDYLIENNKSKEIEEHLENCQACHAEFEEIQNVVQSLKPKVDIRASGDFTNNLLTKLKLEDKKMKRRMPFLYRVAAAAIALLLMGSIFAVILNNDSSSHVSANTAPNIFAKSLKVMSDAKSIHLEMKIRTLERDNFELIGTNYDFVKHYIKTDFSTPQKWRIEKPGRVVICDGKNQYLNIINNNFILQGPVDAGFVQWVKIFLTPDKILETEKQRSEQQQSDYSVKENKNQLILTVSAKAQGDYTNDYLKNKSVIDSDNKRIFTFDKKTYQLLAFQLYIIKNDKEYLVMKTTKITYDEIFDPKEFEIQSLGNKKIKDIKDLDPKADEVIKNMTAEQAARYFFNACSENNWKNVEKVCPFVDDNLKKHLGGIQVIEVRKSFTSGLYKGFFVPYTIKLKNGETKSHNLAIRNDNAEQMWQVDGGI